MRTAAGREWLADGTVGPCNKHGAQRRRASSTASIALGRRYQFGLTGDGSARSLDICGRQVGAWVAGKHDDIVDAGQVVAQTPRSRRESCIDPRI